MTRVLIVGVTGQDGSYLAEHLLGEGCEVFGLVRRARVAAAGVRLLPGDLLSQASLRAALRVARPDEVYNVAAVTSPGAGWGNPVAPLMAEVTGLGVLNLCEAMLDAAPDARLVHASSSAVYDPARYGLYGAAKVFAHQVVAGYRGRLHASNAVLFSHTSPRQDARFLAPTICATVARVAAGSPERLSLTDLAAARDWGFAGDYARALPLIARRSLPSDVPVATGRRHTVGELLDAALDAVGLPAERVLRLAAGPFAAGEVPADTTRLAALGWKPKVCFGDMVRLMVEAQVAACR